MVNGTRHNFSAMLFYFSVFYLHKLSMVCSSYPIQYCDKKHNSKINSIVEEEKIEFNQNSCYKLHVLIKKITRYALYQLHRLMYDYTAGFSYDANFYTYIIRICLLFIAINYNFFLMQYLKNLRRNLCIFLSFCMKL